MINFGYKILFLVFTVALDKSNVVVAEADQHQYLRSNTALVIFVPPLLMCIR